MYKTCHTQSMAKGYKATAAQEKACEGKLGSTRFPQLSPSEVKGPMNSCSKLSTRETH